MSKKIRLIRRLLPLLLLAQAMTLSHAHGEPVPRVLAPGKTLHHARALPAPISVEEVEARGRWAEAALLARPLIFDCEDHQFLHGEKNIGNFGVWVPRPIDLPPPAALERYRNSERVTIDFIVDELGAGPEKNLTVARMAQIYSFVHNVTPKTGAHALQRLKTGGFASAQAFMGGIVREYGTGKVLPGLRIRREDERKLGAGVMSVELLRRTPEGKPYTLAALQSRYEDFVAKADAALARAKSRPAQRSRKAVPIRYDLPAKKLRMGFTPEPV